MRLPVYPAPINHILRANSWAQDALKPHAGKIARFDCAPFTCALGVTDAGEIATTTDDARPDVTVQFTPGIMLRVLARDATAWSGIKADGDVEFAAAINHVVRNIRWDAEEDLSRIFGDIAAHRMVETGRKFDQWGRQSADHVARSFADYWTEEQPLIAARADVERFNRDVDVLRDDIARLEKRIERLAARGAER